MYRFIKRFIDLLIATVALILLSPILLLSIIILSITGEHEIFYFQKRMGYKNKLFNIWKFATMLKNSPNMGTGEITLRNDPRVTKFGKLLRISKINELPQIINVFKGDMSIVGPRPLMEVSFKLYPQHVQEVIYNSKPGITGIGSLIFRDEEKLVSQTNDPKAMYAAIYPYKGQLELWYQKNASVYTDLMIIFLTGWSILFPGNKIAQMVFKNLPARPF
ncbi:MAG: sugar transferase [Ferruginibacter sp.]|nr:sugar transferase [Bacteroidota bacterium]MBX2918388.1 sugar transferase [Ferruginibacter sp.]MCB0709091.1 sugar transferase [Chitinophagaceae bacterium]MCC7378036.1 sugar transferase [Chitinophagaceae bacterium]